MWTRHSKTFIRVFPRHRVNRRWLGADNCFAWKCVRVFFRLLPYQLCCHVAIGHIRISTKQATCSFILNLSELDWEFIWWRDSTKLSSGFYGGRGGEEEMQRGPHPSQPKTSSSPFACLNTNTDRNTDTNTETNTATNTDTNTDTNTTQIQEEMQRGPHPSFPKTSSSPMLA